MTADSNGLSELNRLSSRLWQMRNLQAGLDEMLRGTMALLGAELGNIQLLDESRQALVIRAHRGFQSAFLDHFGKVTTADNSACGRTLRSGQRTIIEDVETDEPYTLLRPVARAAGYRAVVSTPLIGRTGQLVGMMSAHFRSPHRPDEQSLRLLDLYARQAADFIDRLEADAALRRSEQRYRALVTASSEVAYKMSADWSLLYPLDGRSLVDSNAEPIPDWLTRNIPTEEHARIRTRVDEAIADKSLFHLEHRVVRPDGSIGWALSRAVPILDDTNDVVEWFGTAADITDRKRAEEALREGEERFRQMANSIPQLAWYANADGYITWYNRRWYDYTGTTPAEMEGWGWQSVHDAAMLPQVLERWRASIETGEPFEMEFPLKGADGIFRPFLTRVAPLRDDAGAVVQWFGTNTDVTEQRRAAEALRESEQRLRQMADTMAHMIWVTRPDGYHEWYNRRWYEFTGVPEGSTDGEGWSDMFHPDDQARAWATWQHSLATGTPYEIEYRLRHHSGGYRWVLGRALPIRNDRSQIERWFGTCTDIHAMRQLVDEREHLLQSEQAARLESDRASRMKDEFLATLSHEIRTPLNAILGWATMLRAGQVSGDSAAQGLEVIERNARVQTHMIEDLLDMSRIVSGMLRLDVQQVDLAGVIQASVETVQPAARAKEIRVQLVLDPSAGLISGDPHRLQQVFWNLLSNAIKFTPRNGHVQVLLERTNSHVEVSVIDTGEGIDPAFLPQIFDRFRQADSTTTRRHGGLGLGLAIVKQLLELHGGTIRAHSPGTDLGATFVASLPVATEMRTAPTQVLGTHTR